MADPNLDQLYPYLGCGWYYHFADDDDRFPYFWVDGVGENNNTDVYYMHLWKGTTGSLIYTTVITSAQPTLAITTQPQDYTGPIGETAAFTVAVNREDVTYQWQYWTGSKWSNTSIVGNKTATLTPAIIMTRNGYSYRCIITTKDGSQSVTSEAGALIVVASSNSVKLEWA